MSQGTVIFYNNQTGFGIIADDKGYKVFVHYSAVQTEGYMTLHEGQRVCFDVQKDKKEPVAVNVKSL
jgi:CspA family cold shock protein